MSYIKYHLITGWFFKLIKNLKIIFDILFSYFLSLVGKFNMNSWIVWKLLTSEIYWPHNFSVFTDTAYALLLTAIFLFALMEKYLGHKHTKEGSGQTAMA